MTIGVGSPLDLAEGDVIAGKYRIERVLGAGGMGVVVAAHHLQLDERVAIKLMLPESSGNSEAVARFAREARAAVKIKSEHVARVSDVGTLDNGAPYLVMEFLDGEDLSQWLARRGALPIEQAVEFTLHACEALAEAHSLGIVHRDLKPANLYCVRRADGLLSIKVLDFGISKMTTLSPSGSDMAMTKTAAIMGSPLYMSPEQMQSARSVDARSDIWAMGTILFELLGARPPFTGETFMELVLNVSGGQPAALRVLRSDVPVELEQVILRCLEKDRARRFQNIGEFSVALLPFAPKRSRSSVERISRVIVAAGLSASALQLPPSSTHEKEPTPVRTEASWGNTGTSPAGRRSSSIVPLIAGGTLLAVIAAGAVVLRAGTPSGAADGNALTAAPSAPASSALIPAATASLMPAPAVASPLPAQSSAPVPPSSSATTPGLVVPRTTGNKRQAPPPALVATPISSPSQRRPPPSPAEPPSPPPSPTSPRRPGIGGRL